MHSWNELLNVNFFVILGIVLLVISGVVVYMEYKFKHYEHKLSSMVSLVSAFADEIGDLKQQKGGTVEQIEPTHSNGETKLIHIGSISNKSDSDDESDSESDSESDGESDSESDSDGESDDNSTVSVKVLPDDVNNNDNETMNIKVIQLTDDDYNKNNEKDNNSLMEELFTNSVMEDTDDDNVDDDDGEDKPTHHNDDFKTMNLMDIDADVDQIDYKKMPVSKLRDIASDRDIIKIDSKLKKNDIIKLLEEADN